MADRHPDDGVSAREPTKPGPVSPARQPTESRPVSPAPQPVISDSEPPQLDPTRPEPLDRDTLAAEMGGWVRAGLLTEEQATRILARYPAPGASTSRGPATPRPPHRQGPPPRNAQGAVGSVLYGVAAILLGASALTFVLVLSPRADPDPSYFFVLGLGLGALGLGIRAWGRRKSRRWPDAIWQTVLTGALLPLSAAGLAAADDPTALPFTGAGLTAALALLWGLRRVPFTSPIAVVCAAILAAAGVSSWLGRGDPRAWVTAGVHLLLVVATIRILSGGKAHGGREQPGETHGRTAQGGKVDAGDAGAQPGDAHPVSVALAVGAFALSLWAAVRQVVGLGDAQWALLVVGGVMAGGVALGIRLRQQGLVLGGGVALAFCGIAFAFTVGGVLLGTGVLTATALLLIWKASRLLGT